MKLRTNIYSLLGLLLFLFSSCHRQDLEYEYSEKALIPIHVDWSVCQLSPQNVTLLFYSEEDGHLVMEHRFANNDNNIQSYVALPVGDYTVEVFNELRNEVKHVGMLDYEVFFKLKAFIEENQQAVARQSSSHYLESSGVLASSLLSFSVTEEMVIHRNSYEKMNSTKTLSSEMTRYSTDALMHIVPERKVGRCEVVLHVKNLKSSRFPVLVDVNNIASQYNFSTDLNLDVPATAQLQLKDHAFDEKSSRDGTVKGYTYNFGVMNNRLDFSDQPLKFPLELLVRFMLVDEEKTIKSYKIMLHEEDVEFIKEEDTSVTFRIQLSLSEALPEVDPAGTKGESGFNISVDEWDVIDVPLVYE